MPKSRKLLFCSFILLIANSGFLAAFAHNNLFYYANVLLHIILGLLLIGPFAVFAWQFLRTDAHYGKGYGYVVGHLGYFLMLLTTGIGIYLLVVGSRLPQSWVLHTHIITAFLACIFMISSIRRAGYNISVENVYATAGRWGLVTVIIAMLLPLFASLLRLLLPNDDHIISNPTFPPVSLEQAALRGARGPFFASPAETTDRGPIHTDFLTDSESCGVAGCHPDIYVQWQESAHRQTSFSNARYRESFLDLRKQRGVDAGNFCSGCHSPALLFGGKSDQAGTEIESAPEASVGIGCNACHAVQRVKSTMGNANYVIARPALFSMATSKNPVIRKLSHLFNHLDPAPHRYTYLKPFHKEQTGAFCSSCHKISLDAPVRTTNWLPGFDEYDEWQMGSFAGKRVATFYDVDAPRGCKDCHMPLVPSRDAGNKEGAVHDHRFLATGSVFRSVEDGQNIMSKSIDFMMDDRLSLDIFALRADPGKELSLQNDSSLAKIANNAYNSGQDFSAALAQRVAPADRADLKAGDTIRVDVVVRSQDIGHAFPSGRDESSNAWIEFTATDDAGRIIFASGIAEHTAQMRKYGRFLDSGPGDLSFKGHGYAVDGRVHTNLIPPNSADVASYIFAIPEDFHDSLHLTAKLQYGRVTSVADHGAFQNGAAEYASGFAKLISEQTPLAGISEPPTRDRSTLVSPVTLAIGSVDIAVDNTAVPTDTKTDADDANLYLRWNDYGIGLFLRRALPEALAVFGKVTELNPDYADGWVNVARCYLDLAQNDAAITALEKALACDPGFARARFFLAVAYKSLGQYDEAAKLLRKIDDVYCEDRVFLNFWGQVNFLQKDYRKAIRILKKAVLIAPENPFAHYVMMEAFKMIGDSQKARDEELLFQKFSQGVPPEVFLEASLSEYANAPWGLQKCYQDDSGWQTTQKQARGNRSQANE